jgi:hypothetical protein
MIQSAAVRPDPTFLRKATIANGGVIDHAGSVRIEPMVEFDLNRTIFQTLQGKLPRFVMKARIAKDFYWNDHIASQIQRSYEGLQIEEKLPEVSSDLLTFLMKECNFDVEHAEGSFLDHLYFGFEYCAEHYQAQSPLVMLLHSILGTGTNTFAMEAGKMPDLKALVNDFEWLHIESFPSILRLLYAGDLRKELWQNIHRPDALKEIRFHRVIDNELVSMSGEDFWIQLNYQLIHIIDFLPAANWVAHKSEFAFIIFRDLYDLMGKAGKRDAHVNYTPANGTRQLVGETHNLASWLVTLIPVGYTAKTAARSVTNFSNAIGHSLKYEIDWD